MEKRDPKNSAKSQEHWLSAEFVSEEFVEGNFLGLPDIVDDPDVVILQIPYELTTSYGQGTALGPAACVAASGQVELLIDYLVKIYQLDTKSTPLHSGMVKVT